MNIELMYEYCMREIKYVFICLYNVRLCVCVCVDYFLI